MSKKRKGADGADGPEQTDTAWVAYADADGDVTLTEVGHVNKADANIWLYPTPVAPGERDWEETTWAIPGQDIFETRAQALDALERGARLAIVVAQRTLAQAQRLRLGLPATEAGDAEGTARG